MSDNKPKDTTGSLINWKDFLEKHPPNITVTASNVLSDLQYSNIAGHLNTPNISLYCNSEVCQGLRTFACMIHRNQQAVSLNGSELFLNYQCRNCKTQDKIFAVFVVRNGDAGNADVYKFGEFPVFGPHVPPRMLRLIQRDVELFNKGRRAENLGLGVGAYAYYRQVVENQKEHLILEIIKVAKKLNAPPEVVTQLERAKTQFQFTQSVEDFKDAIPQVLLMNGHNPLLLLHSALSKGLHDETDEECLELAHHIRVVLTELAERISQALKDEAELNTAVSKLMAKK